MDSIHPRVTAHFTQRQAERHLRPEVLGFIYWYGTEFRGAGAIHLTVVARDLPAALQSDPRACQSRDWIVVLSKDGTLITCYRRPHATRFLRRKSGAHDLDQAA